MSKHLKKYAAPTSWPVTRKDRVYITKTMPGPHSIQQSLNIALILIVCRPNANASAKFQNA